MKVSRISKYDTSNWSGINTSVFFTGCTHNCPGCFNDNIQDFEEGVEFDRDMEDILFDFLDDKYVSGLCILGGEPFQQDMSILYRLVYKANVVSRKPVHIWSGYTYEELQEIPGAKDVLRHCTTLIDGRFDITKKDLSLKFRGSSNQRILKLNKGEIVNED